MGDWVVKVCFIGFRVMANEPVPLGPGNHIHPVGSQTYLSLGESVCEVRRGTGRWAEWGGSDCRVSSAGRIRDYALRVIEGVGGLVFSFPAGS